MGCTARAAADLGAWRALHGSAGSGSEDAGTGNESRARFWGADRRGRLRLESRETASRSTVCMKASSSSSSKSASIHVWNATPIS